VIGADDRLAQQQVQAKNPVLAEANIAALNAGHAYGETAELGGPLRSSTFDAVPARRGCTARHRRRSGQPRPGRGRAARRPADVLRRLSDHARQAILHNLVKA
jgi:2-oxoglutarate ferredoxin oxidoreductase subunit alpha